MPLLITKQNRIKRWQEFTVGKKMSGGEVCVCAGGCECFQSVRSLIQGSGEGVADD